MNIEQKAKAYDEALGKAEDALNDGTISNNTIAYLQDIFPELKESEDDRIRKEIIKFIKVYKPDWENYGDYSSWIAWLEKQGDIDRRIQEEIEKQTKQLWKAEKQCEPKFRVGDVMRTWQEAFNGIIDGLPVVVAIDDENYRCNNEIISITDQEDYEYPPMNRKQNFAWSEEDENAIKVLMNIIKKSEIIDHLIYTDLLKEKLYDFLKSLKERYTWKPSDEQMEAVKRASNGSRAIAGKDYLIMESLYNDLEKLTE